MGEPVRHKKAPVLRLAAQMLTDREIIVGVCAGDPSAADALVERYGASIDKRVWRLLGADSEHGDVVQQVYLRLFQAIPRVRDPEALPDWIAKVTVNVVRNELRSRKHRRLFAPIAEASNDSSSALGNPDHGLRLRRAFEILERMRIDDRIAFIMRFIEGAELKEIGIATDRSLATVKRRVARARDAFLKKALRDPILASLAEEGQHDER